MTPQEFIAKWKASTLKERAAAQEHFIDLCRLLEHKTPAEIDPDGDWFTFEKGLSKTGGGKGWADVWKRGCFAWEYKGKHKDLDRALVQLQQYAVALENPPLLVVSDMETVRIHTNFTNTVQEIHLVHLDELTDPAKLQLLRQVFNRPEQLKPDKTRDAVTAEVAKNFAALAQRLRARGHEPLRVAHFTSKLLFCMFAEDAGLFKGGRHVFTEILEACREWPGHCGGSLKALFAAMSGGGIFGTVPIDHFNGGLFDGDDALPLEREDMRDLLHAAYQDWRDIEPSIFGTLFERGLDPDKRSQLGAHYTDPASILRIVRPVVLEPLEAKWGQVKADIEDKLAKSKAKGIPKAALDAFNGFMQHLAEVRILDPACGSGNFLYLALRGLKDLEHRANIEAEALGLPRQFSINAGPHNVFGIELNPYAAELARVTLWIGHIQWMLRNGYNVKRTPVLDNLDQIQCRDAVMDERGMEPEWPEVDYIVGNPPFLGDKKMLDGLGADYVARLRALYKDRVPGGADLVTYWFERARGQLARGKAKAAGLVSTNSIRGGANRKVLERIRESGRIFNAWSDEPWVNEGAAVRVSLVCFEPSPPAPLPEGEGSQAPSPPAPLPEGEGSKAPSPPAPLPEGEGSKAPSPPPPLPGGEGSQVPLPSGEGFRVRAAVLGGFPGKEENQSPSPVGRGVRGEGKEAATAAKPALPPELLKHARELRHIQADAEKLLWGILRGRRFLDLKFRRQHPVTQYILDFYCEELKLGVELDGGQHNEDAARRYDETRSKFLAAQGIRVVRFWNRELFTELETVLEALYWEVEKLKAPSPPPPLPKGEGSKAPSPPAPLPGGEGSQVPLPSGEGFRVRAATLNGSPVREIYADLTGAAEGGNNLAEAKSLAENKKTAFLGGMKKGAFDIPGDLARAWLALPNPNGRPNRDVLRPWLNGMDITRRPSDTWIIDFGVDMPEEYAALYEKPFEYVVAHVKPEREKVRNPLEKAKWWLHARPAPDLRKAVAGLPRVLITPRVAKYRLFVWMSAAIVFDGQLVVIARADDTTFGILHSRFHELWALRMGTSLEDRPRYTPTTTFETFPFPAGLTPNLPAEDYAADPRAQAIAAAARRLDELRENWLNPPEWVKRVPEAVPGYPDRILPVDDKAAEQLKKRTLTNLYNQRPAWLNNAHKALDAAVAGAYGWEADLADDEILRRLLALNLERGGT